MYTRRLMRAQWCRSAIRVRHSLHLMRAVNFESEYVLPRRTAAIAGQQRAERNLVGIWNMYASTHRLGYYNTCTFFGRSTQCRQENGVSKFPGLREEDNNNAVLGSGAECAAMQYVEVCELLATHKRHTTL